MEAYEGLNQMFDPYAQGIRRQRRFRESCAYVMHVSSNLIVTL